MKQNKQVRISFGNRTDVGRVRETNQDYYGKYSGEFGVLIIVCDGMGGYKGGEVAAQTAVEAIYTYINSLEARFDPQVELLNSLSHAQYQIDQHKTSDAELADMGTTAVVVLIQEWNMWYAWIGDSRIYLKRRSSLQQITKDHSYVQELVDQGIITPEQAKDHPHRNKIVQALGSKINVGEAKGPLRLYRGDVLMMCSDGLYGYFDDLELAAYLEEEPQLACDNMVELAKARGGEDNITIQVCRIENGDSPPKIRKPKAQNRAVRLSFLSYLIVLVSHLACLLVMAWYLASEYGLFVLKDTAHAEVETALDSLSPEIEDTLSVVTPQQDSSQEKD